MAFDLHLNEAKNLIEMSLSGSVTGSDMQQMLAKGLELANGLSTRVDRVNALADISKVEEINPEARKAALDSMNSLGFDRLAIVGQHGTVGVLAKTLVGMSGMHNVKFFADRAAAEAWLLEV